MNWDTPICRWLEEEFNDDCTHPDTSGQHCIYKFCMDECPYYAPIGDKDELKKA